jgi:hypothetical protein
MKIHYYVQISLRVFRIISQVKTLHAFRFYYSFIGSRKMHEQQRMKLT